MLVLPVACCLLPVDYWWKWRKVVEVEVMKRAASDTRLITPILAGRWPRGTASEVLRVNLQFFSSSSSFFLGLWLDMLLHNYFTHIMFFVFFVFSDFRFFFFL